MHQAVVSFFQSETDYLLFCYGFAFILLASIALLMVDRSKYELPWRWLGFFGIAHGAHEWLSVLLAGFEGRKWFYALEILLLALSFLALIEFGRQSVRDPRSIFRSRAIYFPLLAFTVAPWFFGSGLQRGNIACHYALGFPGAFWAAAVFYRESSALKEGRNFLILAALGMFLYSIGTVIAVPRGDLLAAAFLNEEFFLDLFGFPIQLAGGFFVLLVLSSSVRFYESRNRLYVGKKILPTFWLFPSLLLFLAGGWVIIAQVGKDTDRDIRTALLARAITAAASVNSDQVKKLTGSPEDRGTADFEAVKRQIGSIHRVNRDCRYAYLLGIRDGKVFFFDDSEALYAKGEIPTVPGDVYDEASPRLIQSFTVGEAFTEGPLTDKWGTWISGYGAVRDAGTGQTVAVLGLDMDAKEWRRAIAAERKDQISKIMLFALLFAVFFVFYERMREFTFRIGESELRLKQAQGLAHIGSWIWDAGAESPAWSEELFRITGRDPKLGAPSPAEYERFIHPQDWPAWDATFRHGLQEGRSFELETRIFRPDGVLRYVLCKGQVERGGDGNVARIVGTLQDVTDRKVVEQALRLRDHAISEASCGIIISDATTEDYRIIYVNSCFERMTGFPASEVIGCPCPFLFGKYRDVPELETLRIAIKEGRECRSVFQYCRKDGSSFWAELNFAPVHGERGRIVNYVGVQTDITDRKQVEQLKDEFVGIVTHELRSPMQVIQESMSQLEEGLLGEINEKQRQFLRMNLGSIRRLVRLVNDLLDIAKIEAGKVHLKKESFDLVELAREIVEVFRHRIESKGLEVRVIPEDRPVPVFADRDRMHQMLSNLIGNALKFTEKGFIEVSITARENAVECSIADSGCGILAKDLPRMFGKFQQFKISPSGEKGSGLGLAICKAIVEAHDGKIWVASRPEQGTIFTFILPKLPRSG